MKCHCVKREGEALVPERYEKEQEIKLLFILP